MSIVELTDGQIFAADVRDGDHGNVTPQNDGGEQIKTFRVLITGFGPHPQHKVNPSWLAVKALHNVTITSDQWEDVFLNIVVPVQHGATCAAPANTKSPSPVAGATPSASSTIRSLGNGDASGAAATSGGASMSTRTPSPFPRSSMFPTTKSSMFPASSRPSSAGKDSMPEDPVPKAFTAACAAPLTNPYNIHITAIEIPMVYEEVLSIVPGLHIKPPQLPKDNSPPSEDLPPPPDHGYDFILHVGVAGRGSLRMEIIGHKNGYNMKDASGAYCAVVPPISATKNLNNNRGPGASPPGPVGPLILSPPYTGGGIHGSGFGSMGMGYNNERLGYNPAVHDPQPGIPGLETSHRPMRGFGAAYETFPDEMATDIDVTRLVQDLKASGVKTIYTSMDAGHYLGDFIYYCSLAESKRSSKALLPFLTNTPYIAPSPHYGPTYGPQAYQIQTFPAGSSNAHTQTGTDGDSPSTRPQGPANGSGAHQPITNKPARVLLMHCPPVDHPLTTEQVTEAIRRIVMWVGREMELMDMRELAAMEPDTDNIALAPPPPPA